MNISAKDFQVEIERMWQLKTSIISIVVSALGLGKQRTSKHLEKVPGKQNLAEIHKNSYYLYCAHIKKSVISISYNKKDQREIKTQKLKKQQKHKISFPVASGFGQTPGSWIAVNREQKKQKKLS